MTDQKPQQPTLVAPQEPQHIDNQMHTSVNFGVNVFELVNGNNFPGEQSENVSDLKQICQRLAKGELKIVPVVPGD